MKQLFTIFLVLGIAGFCYGEVEYSVKDVDTISKVETIPISYEILVSRRDSKVSEIASYQLHIDTAVLEKEELDRLIADLDTERAKYYVPEEPGE